MILTSIHFQRKSEKPKLFNNFCSTQWWQWQHHKHNALNAVNTGIPNTKDTQRKKDSLNSLLGARRRLLVLRHVNVVQLRPLTGRGYWAGPVRWEKWSLPRGSPPFFPRPPSVTISGRLSFFNFSPIDIGNAGVTVTVSPLPKRSATSFLALWRLTKVSLTFPQDWRFFWRYSVLTFFR